MEDCIFCKIANGKIKTEIVYEDKNVVIFPDMLPKAKVHLLAIPKKHYKDITDITEKNPELTKDFLNSLTEYAKNNIGDFRLIFNTGENAGQSVFHTHAHILSGNLPAM
jgi:histidine triad (HIT) family protein